MGSSGFSSSSTAEEVTQGINGSGLTAIVTGENHGVMRDVEDLVPDGDEGERKITSIQTNLMLEGEEVDEEGLDAKSLYLGGKGGTTHGIGTETARVLALRGVHVIMAARDVIAAKAVKEAILKEIPTAKVDAMELDLSSMTSVRKFALEYISSGLPLNILIYQKWHAYGQSKLANILHANELTRLLKEDGIDNITANSLHPGAIMDTNIYKPEINGPVPTDLINRLGSFLLKNIQQGAATTCYVALHPQVRGISGEYFSDNNLAKASSLAKDTNLAKKLWDFSMKTIDYNTHEQI
ncbi:Short-chain dehydrogenase TIC 32, chloroplastic [Glycine soja]|uniref:Short-chain dehydrogenase TIC 32, chloroplastic n=1 Tax=Glycine soja TaxID=3848 RepID=A0A445J0N1_GLYSO|nr:Short-chain dehydrogenase TIC 32, chloroplastic [Glycine soja]